MLERENRELDERLAELYLEWITKNSGTGYAGTKPYYRCDHREEFDSIAPGAKS